MTTTQRWIVQTKDLHREVDAADQWEAFDTLTDELPAEMGFIVTAKRVGDPDEEQFACRTSFLQGTRWGRPAVARAFIATAIASGLPDTTELDIP